MIDCKTIPTTPGCYLFKDAHTTIIYVGKATNLRKRVTSYFKKPIHDPKTISLVHHIVNVDYIATNTEVEAFILENTLIKKNQPKYNINLKDAKTYAYIQVTDEDFPRVLIARQKNSEGKYFGPFVSAQERDYILWVLRKTFNLRTCKKLPKKACLRYHIHLCDAPCIGCISKEAYNTKIMHVMFILSGKTKELTDTLKKDMTQCASGLEFEHALQIRNQLEAIQHLHERQNVQRQMNYNEDIIHYRIHDGKVYLMVFNIYKGTLTNKNEYVFDITTDFFEEFLIQYYSDNPVPSVLIIPTPVSSSLKSYLEQQKKKKVRITIPRKGVKKQLLDLVLKNIELNFFGDTLKMDELKKQLNLQETPQIIECFDISHLSGTLMVGSMVQFRNGKPDKNNYRRFRIRTVEGIDDVAAIGEIVRRRYKRIQEESVPFPNLIIIDGGRSQLNSALAELHKLDITIPVIALAKQFEEIYLPEQPQPLRLAKKEKTLQFIQEIRDEAHRFAITYNRLLRKKKLRS
jgi:excinuclease ABC subunit C